MLKLQQIEVGYGDSMVVRNASLRVNDNQVVCVIGRNGVGKTTILKTIIGILTPKNGSILFKNENITSKSPSSRARKGIGYVPQGREIFPKLTVYENLLLGLEASTEKKKRIPEEIYQYFPILKEFAKRNGGDLSGGQQQQLAIARALVANPSFLLLDEPTEGIQPNIVAEIQEVIRTIKKKGQTSIILVEQNLEFAKNVADYIYVIDHGTVVYEGYAKDINEEKVKQYLSV
jgi:urea transport system ATP-binding protein